jgi:restriction modification system DNA specificity subunit (fragment)
MQALIPNSNVERDYLLHLVRSLRLGEGFSGSTIPHIYFKDYGRIEVPLPSLEVQKQIVSQLGLVEAQITQVEAQIEQFDQLIKSRFVEMFGKAEDEHSDFPVKTLNDVCTSIVRGPFGSALKKEFFVPKRPGAYKVYEQKHAIQKQVDIGTYYISRDRFETLKRFECHPGDILMSCSGTMGKLYQLPQNCEPGVMNQALCKFTLSNSITADYFLGFMEQVVDELGVKGSGIKNVSSVKFIKAIRIPLPPVELQERFAAFVSQVDKSRFVAQQQVEKLQMLYDSLAQEYFGD